MTIKKSLSGEKTIERKQIRMNGEVADINQLLESEVEEIGKPDSETLFNLLEKKDLLKESLSLLDEEQFNKYATRITQFAIRKAGLDYQNIGLHFLRGPSIKGIFKYGFRPNFHDADGATSAIHRTIDYWLFDEQTSILDLDEKMNGSYRRSPAGGNISLDFVLIDRGFVLKNGKEEYQLNNSEWTRGVLPINILKEEHCPPETLFGLGAISPLGITTIRHLNKKDKPRIDDQLKLEREELLRSGENEYLRKELTRNNKIDMLLRFVESLAYIASQRKISKD